MRVMAKMPPAMTSGPAVMGKRGPMRWASAPARADRASMSRVTGSIDAPAASGEYLSTVWRNTTSMKNTPLRAAYTAKVTRLAPVNWCEEKMSSGSMGWRPWASTATKAPRAASPATAADATPASTEPRLVASMRAKVTPASPKAQRAPPATSMWASTVTSRVSGTCLRATSEMPI